MFCAKLNSDINPAAFQSLLAAVKHIGTTATEFELLTLQLSKLMNYCRYVNAVDSSPEIEFIKITAKAISLVQLNYF